MSDLGPERSLTGRDAACRAIARALAGEEFVADQIRSLRRDAALDVRDAGLALEIAAGAVRHAITLEHVLSSVADYAHHRVAPEIRAILYAAAYQVIYLDHIPVFAAVDEAVTLARRDVGVKPAGMVNAVLRRLSRAIAARRVDWPCGSRSDGAVPPRLVRVAWNKACAFNVDIYPATTDRARSTQMLATATGCRVEMLQQLIDEHGLDAAESAAWALAAPAPTVVQRNALKLAPAEFAAAVCALDAQAEFLPPDVPNCAFLAESGPLIRSELFTGGAAYIQDTTAQSAVAAVDAKPGERILDLCAAPGGKSLGLAIAMENRGEVTACDVAPERLARIRENRDRLGLTCIQPRVIPEHSALPREMTGFDAVLVDVPCTNSGVIARRPEARFAWDAENRAELVQLQARLLRLAAGAVRPGGRLVYSTCSIDPAENASVVAQFAKSTPGWSVVQSAVTLPRWGPRLSDWRDGGFHAVLRR